MNNTSERTTVLATAALPVDAVRAIRHNDGTLCRIEHLPVIHALMAAGEVQISEQPDVTGLYAVQAVRVDMSAVLTVRQVRDDNPDTSYIGSYTDDADEWCIIRATGEYVAKVLQRRRIIDTLRDWIDYGDDLAPETIARYEARIARVEASGETELPSRGREYRYFRPYAGGEVPGTADYRKYGLQDWKRMEALNNGDWHYVGIIATVTLTNADGFKKVVKSAGLWKIESDSSADHFKEMAREQVEEIRAEVEKYAPMPEWGGEFDGNN
jgi:hypothetical protein